MGRWGMCECFPLVEKSFQAMHRQSDVFQAVRARRIDADHAITGLFQGDQDLDIRSETEYAMGLTSDDADYDAEKELKSTAFRDKLNAGLCDKLFKDFRSKENTVSL